MQTNRTRRRFLTGSATAGAIALAGCTGGGDDEENGDEEANGDENGEDEPGDDADTYEVWALDQGQDTIHVYEPAGDDEFDETETIDVNALEGVPDEGVVPHMIDFSSDYEYAAVACTAGARTLVFRTEDKELVGNVETGPRTHMASFSPDDEYIHVDVIGDPDEEYGWIVRLEADFEEYEFAELDRIDFSENEVVDEEGVWPARPICHQFTGDGRTIHTLGPAHGDGGLVIVDHDDFSVDRAYPQEEAPINCGTMPHYEDDAFYLTAGRPSNPDEGVDGIGEYYVYDTAEDEFAVEGADSAGVDAHGFWFTPDGEELWLLNRETNDGLVLDPDTNDVIEEIDEYGPATGDEPETSDAPDIMWSSPDGEYMFVTLRGPAPLSGGAHASTGVNPGFAVVDVESRERVAVVEPDPIEEYDDEEIEAARAEDPDAPRLPDFHGIGVRPVDDFDTEIPNSPAYGN